MSMDLKSSHGKQKMARHYFILPAIAFYLYMAGSAPFLGQWDSFDYLKQIFSHQLSPLGIGRPVFLGYNILLWESARKIFSLAPLRLEMVAMAGAILLGVAGVLLFQRLAGRILPSPASQMAVLALAVSPVYAIYSGFIMTEVPMLAALMAAALVLWNATDRYRQWSAIVSGILFGLAVGIREQAITLGAAYIWILCSTRPSNSERMRSALWFGLAAGLTIIAPAVGIFLFDRAGFLSRTKTWLHVIPMGSAQFRNNVEASLLFTFVICPGAWMAMAGAGVCRLFRRHKPIADADVSHAVSIKNPVWGIVCCLIVPIALLWRDADVQMHPRYTLIALPASLILCVLLYRRWLPSKRALGVWAIIQVLFLGLTLAAFSPYRQSQIRKMEFARMVRESIQGPGLIIAGNYSPILDYYRGIGVRPEWQILWAGWDWDAKAVASRIEEAWANHIPVYWSTDAPGWSFFEREFLDTYFLLQDCKKLPIAPHLYHIYP